MALQKGKGKAKQTAQEIAGLPLHFQTQAFSPGEVEVGNGREDVSPTRILADWLMTSSESESWRLGLGLKKSGWLLFSMVLVRKPSTPN